MLFYVNHPVMATPDGLFARTVNFLDFADLLAARLPNARLAVPVRRIECPCAGLTPLRLSSEVSFVPGYSGHWQALGRSLTNARRLAAMAAERDPPVVLGVVPSSMMTALAALLPASARFVHFVRGDTPRTVLHMYAGSVYGRWPHRLSRFFERRALALHGQGRALVFTYGEHLASRYATHHAEGPYGTPSPRSIAPLIADDWLDAEPVPAPDGARLRVVFIGRLSPEKGLMELLEAMADRSLAEVHLTIAGEGPLAGALGRRINELGIAERVRLAGFVPPGKPVMELLDAHHALILPSHTEGLPHVIAEALARARAVLATDSGGIAGAFGGAVKVLAAARPASIVEGLRWAARERSALLELGRAGRAIANRFTLTRHVDEVAEEVLAWL